jgi:hypothetical protein
VLCVTGVSRDVQTFPHEITLGSAAGVTVARVGSFVVTAARVLGLVLDGPAPFTLHVLKPEVALIIVSTTAFVLERRRRRVSMGDDPSSVHHAALPHSSARRA